MSKEIYIRIVGTKILSFYNVFNPYNRYFFYSYYLIHFMTTFAMLKQVVLVAKDSLWTVQSTYINVHMRWKSWPHFVKMSWGITRVRRIDPSASQDACLWYIMPWHYFYSKYVPASRFCKGIQVLILGSSISCCEGRLIHLTRTW